MSIFFDFQSAFDKVWHDGLVYKLIKIETPWFLVLFIIKFLKDRTFQVKIGNCLTQKKVISNGTPQGSVLSPTLFLIFINDIPIKREKKQRIYIPIR